MAFPNPPKTWGFQESVESSEMNAELRDALLALEYHLIARKTADESVTSSTVLQDDNHLILPVAANEVWQVKYLLRYTAATAGDIKIGFTFPTGGEVNLSTVWANETGTIQAASWSDTTSPSSSNQWDGVASSLKTMLRIEGVYINGANAGNLTLQWAQDTSNATATSVLTHSTLWGVKLA